MGQKGVSGEQQAGQVPRAALQPHIRPPLFLLAGAVYVTEKPPQLAGLSLPTHRPTNTHTPFFWGGRVEILLLLLLTRLLHFRSAAVCPLFLLLPSLPLPPCPGAAAGGLTGLSGEEPGAVRSQKRLLAPGLVTLLVALQVAPGTRLQSQQSP